MRWLSNSNSTLISRLKHSSALAGTLSVAALAMTVTPVQAQEDESEIDTIVVTGSRISRSGVSTPTPTTIIDSEQIALSGELKIGDLLRELPAIAPGVNSQNSNVSFINAGLNLADLRDLGTNRTLVLVNGRRRVGSQPDTTAVDLNTIPSAMVERIEVITGGASAIYGADAVAGVVNLILKDDFQGIELNAQTGVSSRGDGEEYSLNATIGGNFADDRGNAVFHIGWHKQGDIGFEDRPGGISGRQFVPNPSNAGPNDGVDDFIIMDNIRQIGGQQESAFILGGDVFAFNPDGSLRPFELGPSGLVNGVFTDGGEAAIGFDVRCPQARCDIAVPTERFLISGAADYDLTDNTTVFIDGTFAANSSRSLFGSVFEIPPFTNNISIDNPFVTDELRQLLLDNGADSVGILRSDMELGPRGSINDRRTFQITGGVKGALSETWSYEAYYSFGSTRFVNTKINDKFENRWALALDAVVDPETGNIVCRSVLEGNVQDPGCVPINLLASGPAITPDALAFIHIPNATETAELRQQVASAYVSGDLFDNWSGPVSLALGVEYRRESSNNITSAIQQAGLGFFNTTRRATSGSFDVYEAFAETIVPLIRDSSVGDANLEAAVRWADYSTSGNATSWKVGADWSPTSDIRFRGVVSRAVRAPNVGELFSPGSEGFITVDDPCDAAFVSGGSGARAANCSALGITQPFASNAQTINIRTQTSGNPELDVEKSDTYTAGVALTPRWVPNLTLTVDYYKIEIDGAINTLGVQDILNNCVDFDSLDNVFCNSVTRDSIGNILQIRRQNVNVSRFDRAGFDFEAQYFVDMNDLGVVNFNVIATRSTKNEFILAPGTLTGSNTIDNLGEFGAPKWAGTANATWNKGALATNISVRYLGNMVRDVQPTQPEDNRATLRAGQRWYTDVAVRYQISESLTGSLGVNNVFDTLSPMHPDARTPQGRASIYDNTGRYFFLGLSFKS